MKTSYTEKDIEELNSIVGKDRPWVYLHPSKAVPERYSEIGPECDVIVDRGENNIYSIIAPGKDSYARATSLEAYTLLVELHHLDYKIPELLSERVLAEALQGLYSTKRLEQDSEPETFTIELAGFKTKAQAEAFLTWYSNSGEQEASEDFTCRVEEGSLDVTYMGITSNMWEGSTMKVVMDIQE